MGRQKEVTAAGKSRGKKAGGLSLNLLCAPYTQWQRLRP